MAKAARKQAAGCGAWLERLDTALSEPTLCERTLLRARKACLKSGDGAGALLALVRLQRLKRLRQVRFQVAQAQRDGVTDAARLDALARMVEDALASA